PGTNAGSFWPVLKGSLDMVYQCCRPGKAISAVGGGGRCAKWCEMLPEAASILPSGAKAAERTPPVGTVSLANPENSSAPNPDSLFRIEGSNLLKESAGWARFLNMNAQPTHHKKNMPKKPSRDSALTVCVLALLHGLAAHAADPVINNVSMVPRLTI